MRLFRRSVSAPATLFLATLICAYAQEQQQVTPPTQRAQPKEPPYLLEDGGISIEPFYWFTTILPDRLSMKGGAASSASDANLDFPGIIKDAPGGVLSIPAGAQSTIRISYFRLQGRGDEELPAGATLLGSPFYAQDWLSTRFILQNAKVSWDFLTWPAKPLPGKLRFKTLWEAQWVTIRTDISAPYAPARTDSSGTSINNYPTAAKNLFLPTIGGEIEQAPSRHFRYEIKASGFGLPHHGNIWDAEGSLGFRMKNVELLVGAKAFHYKTSPKSDEYFSQTLAGPYAGLRFYITHQE